MKEISANSSATQLCADINENFSSVGNGQRKRIKTIRVCTLNVGHWKYGVDIARFSDAYKQAFKQAIVNIHADILILTEYANQFGGSGTTFAHDELLDIYPYKISDSDFSSQTSDSVRHNAIFSLLPIDSENKSVLDTNTTAFSVPIYVFGKTKAAVVAGHSTPFSPEGRVSDWSKYVTAVSSASRAIIAGDFNADTNEATSAQSVFNGFTLANFGVNGTIGTYPATAICVAGKNGMNDDIDYDDPTRPCDNIVVKGFVMDSVETFDYGCLTDHMALVCDLTLIEEE